MEPEPLVDDPPEVDPLPFIEPEPEPFFILPFLPDFPVLEEPLSIVPVEPDVDPPVEPDPVEPEPVEPEPVEPEPVEPAPVLPDDCANVRGSIAALIKSASAVFFMNFSWAAFLLHLYFGPVITLSA